VIQSADWVVELGPGAGDAGGQIVFEGPPQQLVRAKTATGRYLVDRGGVESARSRTKGQVRQADSSGA
jgi:excinuclease ABC subunit A